MESPQDIDQLAINTIRMLVVDAVQKANSGHPGTPMDAAPAAYRWWQRVLRYDPADPVWPNRDRFVLSCGHASMLLYSLIHLTGIQAFDHRDRPLGRPSLTLDDIKQFRQIDSLTPGHPEHGLTTGVEVTTGPLGQGLANAVGMAMASRRERGLFDPDAAPGTSPFDHFIYVFASDGDIEEGLTHEASAIAGVQELGNLILLYDNNHISIEDDTRIAKDEDVAARYAA